MVLVGSISVREALTDRGLQESDFGWPLDTIECAIHAAQRGWALVSFRPGKVIVENPDGDRITIRAIDPTAALRSLPNERVRA